MINKNIARGLTAASLAALLTACGHLPIAEPAFNAMEEKRAGLPTNWTDIAQPAADLQATVADYSVFGDAQLIAYIQEALENNRTLRAQVEAVRQSEAALKISRSGLWPRLGATFSGQATDGGRTNSSLDDGTFSFGVSGVYDVDIMGDLSASIRASIAGLRSTESSYELARRNLAAQVARLYFAVIEGQLQLALDRRSLERQRETFGITQTRFDAGAIARDELVLGESGLATAEAQILASEASVRAAVRALESALGRYPTNSLTVAGALPEPPTLPPLGLPELTIRARPDVVAAELDMIGVFADTRIAKLSRWPQLNANLGASLQNGPQRSTANLFDFDDFAFSIGASIAQTIFDGGRISGNIELAQSRERAALERYGQTIIDAYGGILNAIDQFNTLQASATSLQTAATANAEVLRLGELRYNEGSQNLLDLFNVRDRSESSESAVIANRRARLEQWIAVHTALGGDPLRATTLPTAERNAEAKY